MTTILRLIKWTTQAPPRCYRREIDWTLINDTLWACVDGTWFIIEATDRDVNKADYEYIKKVYDDPDDEFPDLSHAEFRIKGQIVDVRPAYRSPVIGPINLLSAADVVCGGTDHSTFEQKIVEHARIADAVSAVPSLSDVVATLATTRETVRAHERTIAEQSAALEAERARNAELMRDLAERESTIDELRGDYDSYRESLRSRFRAAVALFEGDAAQ